MYESSCTTKYVEKQPGKFVGDTGCERLPVEICGAGCTFEEGEEECHEKTISASITVPEEACDLQPQEKCQGVYKLVPFLSPTQECKQVPREVCTFGVLKGEPGEKPITTKWCYDPEAESDLLASGVSEEEDSAAPPRDPFLPPTDSFQFPQQSLDPLDLEDFPESEEDSLSLPTYSGYQGSSRERDNLFYIPPAPELSQALEEEDRAGRKVKERKKQKVGTRRPNEEQEEELSFLEEFLETVKQDQEGPVELAFGEKDQLEEENGRPDQVEKENGSKKVQASTSEGQRPRPVQLNDIIPEVFQFPDDRGSQARKEKKKERQAKKNRKVERQKGRKGKGGRRQKGKKGGRKASEGVPKEFRPILSQIEKEAQDRVKFVKGGPGTQLVGHRPIARVIKHSGEKNPISRTVVIENSPEAHQVFGIRNAPTEWGRDSAEVLEQLQEELATPKTSVVTDDGQDLEFSDSPSPTTRTVIIKNTPEDFAKFGVTNVPRELFTHLTQQERTSKAVGGKIKKPSLDGNSVRHNHEGLTISTDFANHNQEPLSDPVISDNSDLQFTLDLSTPVQFSFDPNSFKKNSQDSNLQGKDLRGFGVQSSTSPQFPGKTIDFTFPQASQESESEIRPNSVAEFPSSGLDFSSPEENFFSAQHNLVDNSQNSLNQQKFAGASATHKNFIPGQSQSTNAFKPSPLASPAPGLKVVQGFKVAGSQDNQHILTNRPMTFQTASGEFKPPSTLLYGFKPMTTPLPPPSNHPASHSSPSSPVSLDVRLQRGELQGRRKGRKTPSMLQRISNFLEPITRPISRLMAGL